MARLSAGRSTFLPPLSRVLRAWWDLAASGQLAEHVVKEPGNLLLAVLPRRRQLLEMLVAEKNRLGFAPRPLHKGIQQHIRWLERQLDDVTKDLADQIERSPVWRAKDDLLQSVPGVGPITALNGLLLIGWSVAIIFEVMRMAEVQIARKKGS